MLAEVDISTRDSAPPYISAMRSTAILLPLVFILVDGVACKDDEPAGGDFGDPCGDDPETDEPRPCGEGLDCNIGYCEEKCEQDSDCQPVDGHVHECGAGLCRIVCDEIATPCPQTLATPLECHFGWCTAIGGV